MTAADIKQWSEFKAWLKARYDEAIASDDYQYWNNELKKIGKELSQGTEHERTFLWIFTFTYKTYPDPDTCVVRSGMCGANMNKIINDYTKYDETIEGMLDWLAEGKK